MVLICFIKALDRQMFASGQNNTQHANTPVIRYFFLILLASVVIS